jgi:hypothetical protein
MSEGKWKDSLLKSSLPLEHAVAEQLAKLKWIVWGQYAYARNNESGASVDFSVDIEALKEYSSETHWLATLKLLIECKYASPGVKWLFLPYPRTAELFGGAVRVFDKAANKRVTNRRLLDSIEDNMPYCIRGISLFDSGFDETAIHRGATQLRYAMPRLATQALSSQITDTHDEDINVTIACAILVTSAPIFTLKEGLSLDDVYQAKSLDSLVTEHESVILWDSNAPDRANYSRRLFGELDAEALRSRIEKYSAVFEPTKRLKYPPATYQVPQAISEAGDHVIVVTLKGLKSLLIRLNRAGTSAAKSIERIASLDFDRTTGEVNISNVSSVPPLR